MIISRTLAIVSGLALLCVSGLAALCSQWWPANILTNFHPHLALLGFALLAVGVVWRHWLQAALGATVFGTNAAFVWTQLPALAVPALPDPPGNLRVMTINLLHSNDNLAALRSTLVAETPNAVFLQEVTWRWNNRLRELSALYPYRTTFTGVGFLDNDHGTVLLSRHPILESDRPKLGGMSSRLSAGRIAVAGRTLWVACTHLVKPNTKNGQVLQRRQFRDLGAWVDRAQGSIVLGGDFNSTPFAPQLEQFAESARLSLDVGASSWWRIIAGTYPSWLPLLGLKIDHIMVRDAVIVSARAVRIDGSDHLAVVADVRLPADPR
jgi:endonuclease/exonuclease/phosphatase (EEP) superfamily protein YafD